jgi:predicted metalloprotease with PDZ domain
VIDYKINVASGHTHMLRVRVVIDQPATAQVVSLPVWIPGSYLIREFARHLSGLQAQQGARICQLTQLDKATWQVACSGTQNLVLSYDIYAFDTSVRAAFLSAERCFFNGTSVCLRVHGRETEPCALQLQGVPKAWRVMTAMLADEGRYAYRALNYDELVDHPFEMGHFWLGQFKVAGVCHEMVVVGAWPDFDGPRLLDDVQKIGQSQVNFWHGPKGKPPFERYVFMLHAVEDGYGGLEHRASTALSASRRDLPKIGCTQTSDGYVTLLGLISHEYFHAWNVKRLHPAQLTSMDYTQENYTELLWFFEGFTSYYDDLFLLRSGLIDGARYLKLLAKLATGVLAGPGRRVQSLSQASFDAWVKYYRADENTPNTTVSYYTKGAWMALALDLTLRHQGAGSLDQVMRGLWQRSSGGPIGYDDIKCVLNEVAGRSMDDVLHGWVHGTDDVSLPDLLTPFGVTWSRSSPTPAQQLGLRVSESALMGVKVSTVLTGGLAQCAGVSVGDEIIALNSWRLRRLDEALCWVLPGQAVSLLLCRDGRMVTLKLTWPAPAEVGSVELVPVAQAQLSSQILARQRSWWQG